MADALQKFNLKKASIQKALDTLADTVRISSKEYGKQKIYLARQDQFDIPDTQELATMKEANSKLQQHLEQQKKAIIEVEGGIFPFSIYFISSVPSIQVYRSLCLCCMIDHVVLQKLKPCNQILHWNRFMPNKPN